MGLFFHKCPFCNTRGNILEGACTECGADSRNAPCGECGVKNPLQNNFCRKCGADMRVREAGAIQDIYWRRGKGEIARRVRVDDLRGSLAGGVIVGEGTRALLHIDGRLIETLQPGVYGLDTKDLASGGGKDANIGHSVDVLFVDSASQRLELAFPQVRVGDGVTAAVKIGITLKVDDPRRFSVEVVKDAESCVEADLRARYFAEIKNAVADAYGRFSLADIDARVETKRELEAKMDAHLAPGFGRDGIALDQVQALEIEHSYLDDRGAIAEEGLRADVFARKAEVRQRMRQVVLSDRMEEVNVGDGMRDLLLQEDKGKLLGQKERDELQAAIASAHEDRELARQHLLERLGKQHDAEMAQLQAMGESDLAASLQARELESRRLEDDYAEARAARAAGRRREDVVADAKAETEAERVRAAAKLDAERAEDEADLATMEKLSALKARQEDERAARLIQLQKEGGSEAVVAFLSGPGGAETLAQLKREERFASMTPEQILAVSSPDALARTLVAQAQAQAQSGKEELYREMLDRQERAGTSAMDAVKDIARTMSGAQSAAAQQTIDAHREAQRNMAHVAGRAAANTGHNVVCPSCAVQSPPDSERCGNCGHRFG